MDVWEKVLVETKKNILLTPKNRKQQRAIIANVLKRQGTQKLCLISLRSDSSNTTTSQTTTTDNNTAAHSNATTINNNSGNNTANNNTTTA